MIFIPLKVKHSFTISLEDADGDPFGRGSVESWKKKINKRVENGDL